MLSTQRLGVGRGLGETSSEVGALMQLHRDDVSLVSWHRELPSGLDEQLMEWAQHAPAKFSEVMSLPNYDLSAAMCGLVEPARAWL